MFYNNIFSGTYRIEREIGRGGTSVVYLAYHLRLKKYVVIKRVLTNFEGSLEARTEVDILKNLHHAYLPQVYDILQVGREVYTVMDYIEGWGMDTLAEQNTRFTEAQLYRWLHQLLEVLDYLHSRRPPIIHSDIKPGNIIITPQGNVCLIDFNISLDGTANGKITGYSMYYAAPEQQRLAYAKQQGQPCDIRLNARTDLYSLAATFYTMITGQLPSAQGPSIPLAQLAAGRYTPDFLQLLDHAMAWDPARRYRDAKKMLTALERLKHRDRRYRTYVGLQVLSWVSSALLLGGGLFCAVRGARAATQERYRAAYNSFAQAVRAGDDQSILDQGTALLQQDGLSAPLQNNPTEYASVLHAVGDCYYNTEEYAQAAGYYRDALDAAPEDDPAREVYYEDTAIALAQAGDAQQAQQVLQDARQEGVQAARCDLIAAAIYQQQGDVQACVDTVNAVLQTGDADLCARACLLAADAQAGDLASQLEWLKMADSYQPSRQTLRRLGALYMELARRESYAARVEEYQRLALGCYEAICQEAYPTREDRINLAVVQLSCGQAGAAIQTLTDLATQWPQDYVVEMNLAFAYDAQQDTEQAAIHGSRALRLWRDTAATDREPETSEAIQNLLELQRRLNF